MTAVYINLNTAENIHQLKPTTKIWPIMLAKKYMPMILVSGIVKGIRSYSRGVPRGGASNDSGIVHNGNSWRLGMTLCLVILRENRAQVWQFRRRFDERPPCYLHTDIVQLHTVWSVPRRCTQWNNSLSQMSRQPTTVHIRHRSDTTEGPLRRLWNWSVCKRYENVEYLDSFCRIIPSFIIMVSYM